MAHASRFRLTGGLAVALAGILAAAPVAAQDRVGVTTAVNQRTDVERTAGRRTVVIGENVLFKDRVITSNVGLAQIMFVDGSAFTIASNSRVVIDEFVYNPSTGSGSLAAELTQGALRFVGGKVSKQGGQVRFGTPVGTLGVRGGIVNIDLVPGCLSDGRCPIATASLVFGNELVLNPDGGGPSRRIHDTGYSFLFLGNPASPQVEIVPTSRLDVSNLQSRLSGKAGQNGGAARAPTDADVVASTIPEVNSVLRPVTVLPRPRPEILKAGIAPDRDEVGIPTVTAGIEQNIVEQASSDVVRNDVELEEPVDEAIYLSSARTPGFHPLTPAPVPGVDYAAQTIVGDYPIVAPATYVRDGEGNIVGLRTASGTQLPYSEEPGDTEFVLEQNTFQFNETGEDADEDGRPDTNPVRGVARQRADGFVLYYMEPDQPDGADIQVLYTGYGGTPTPLSVFFPTSADERDPLVRTYTLEPDHQQVRQGVPVNLPLLNPLIAREFGAEALGRAAVTDLLMVDSPDFAEQPGFLQAGLLIDGQGASQRSAVSLGVGFVSGTYDGVDEQGLFALGSRRGSYRLDGGDGSVSMTGALANPDLIIDGEPTTIYGDEGETFVIVPRPPRGEGSYGDPAVGPTRDGTIGFVDVQQGGGGFLGENQTVSGALLLANLADRTPVTAFDRVVAQFEGFASGMVEPDGAAPVAMRSTSTGQFVLQTLVQQSGVGGVVIVEDMNEANEGLAGMQVSFGVGTVDLSSDPGVTGQTEAPVTVVRGTTATETYVDSDTYAAIEGGDGRDAGSPDTLVRLDNGAVAQQVGGKSPGTYVIPSTLAPQPQLFAAAGVTECECAFMEWGWWGTQTTTGAHDGERRDFVHLGTWAAGDVTRQVDMPTTGSARFEGHAVGNVAARVDGQTQQYVAVGDMNMNFDFGERTGNIQFSNFDGRDFGGSLAMQTSPSRLNQFGGSLSGGELGGRVTGAFVDGPAMNAQGVLGSFDVGQRGYQATGTFVGQR